MANENHFRDVHEKKTEVCTWGRISLLTMRTYMYLGMWRSLEKVCRTYDWMI
jgi:hypothetical protein